MDTNVEHKHNNENVYGLRTCCENRKQLFFKVFFIKNSPTTQEVKNRFSKCYQCQRASNTVTEKKEKERWWHKHGRKAALLKLTPFRSLLVENAITTFTTPNHLAGFYLTFLVTLWKQKIKRSKERIKFLNTEENVKEKLLIQKFTSKLLYEVVIVSNIVIIDHFSSGQLKFNAK